MTTATVKGELGIRDYCDTVNRELSEMKAKVFDIMCKVEKMPREERERVKGRYDDFFDLADYIERKIETLTKECPVDWTATKEEIESGKRKLTEAIDWWDAEHIAGGYVGG